MEAIILAGGFGTRLASIVPDTPKPMALVASRPFLYYILDNLNNQGVSKVIMTVHHMSNQVRQIGNKYRGIDIFYLYEESPLGTGGAIKKALNYVEGDDVLILNGDTYLEVEYKQMIDMQIKTRSDIVMAIRGVADTERYSSVEFEANGIVSKFKVKGEPGKPGFIGAGAYIAQKNIFSSFESKQEAFSFEADFFPKMADKILINSFLCSGYFIDIGVPEDYMKAQHELPEIINKIIV